MTGETKITRARIQPNPKTKRLPLDLRTFSFRAVDPITNPEMENIKIEKRKLVGLTRD